MSEEIFFGKVTSGAQDDLQKITRMAYSMVGVVASWAFISVLCGVLGVV